MSASSPDLGLSFTSACLRPRPPIRRRLIHLRAAAATAGIQAIPSVWQATAASSRTFRIRVSGTSTTLKSSVPTGWSIIGARVSALRIACHGGHSHGHHHHHDESHGDEQGHEGTVAHGLGSGDNGCSSCEDSQSHSASHTHAGHDHNGGHSCCHSHGSASLNPLQRAVLKLAQLLGVSKIADLWRDNLRLCMVSLTLLVLGAMGPLLWPTELARTLQTGLAALAFPLTGVSAVLDATIDVAGGKVDIHVLMALAAVSSVIMGNIWEGGLLLTMFSMSHLVEEDFTRRALGDVKALREKNPEVALVLTNFDISSPPSLSSVAYETLPVKHVKAGSYLLVKAGEMVPVDGEVYLGHSMITIEHLTGEVNPLEKHVGDSVSGGARNLDGVLVVKATKSWEDSTVARIMKITQEAQLNKPTLQRWLDTFGDMYSKVVVGISFSVAVLGPILFKWPLLSSPGVRGSIYRGLGLMVSASPCALAVAPLAYATAISACANKGILLRGGEVLDSISACDIVAFDKTGTLTTGELVCRAIEPLHGHLVQGRNNRATGGCCSPSCDVEALAVAAAMEKGATHPIAVAISAYSEGKDLPPINVENFQSFPGEGLAADVSWPQSGDVGLRKAYLGSLQFVGSSSGFNTDSTRLAQSPSGRELVRAALSVNNKITVFHLEDRLRSHAVDVISLLQRQGCLRLLMLTGDHHASAERVAKEVGINEVYSGLKPEEKLEKVKSLSAEDGVRGVIMVGDGINDAPALAAATVGVVLAQRASATAVAVADVLLLQDTIDGVPFLIAKAHQTTTVVKHSVILALCSILAASLPSVLGVLPLWLTVLLHEGGTLLVCLNSARAFRNPKQQWGSRTSDSSLATQFGAAIAALGKYIRGSSGPKYQSGTASS